MKKALFWSDDVYVMAFASPRDITILNTGDGKILLSHISFKINEGPSGTLLINRVIDSGEVITHEMESEEFVRVKNYDVISRLTPEVWNQKRQKARHSSRDPDACITYGIIHERDPVYLQFKNHYGKEFQTIEATASLHVFSLHKRKAKQQFLPVHGLLLRNPDGKCVE